MLLRDPLFSSAVQKIVLFRAAGEQLARFEAINGFIQKYTRIEGTELQQGERRLAAIIFTDIIGYAALSQSDECLAFDQLKKDRDLVRPLFSMHGGREVKTMGDAFLIEFQSALAAIECARDIEKSLRRESREKTGGLRVRIGIHVGDVIHEGEDVFGDAVNIASRIETLAQGGGTCISHQVYDQVRNEVPFGFSKLETRDLKNISLP